MLVYCLYLVFFISTTICGNDNALVTIQSNTEIEAEIIGFKGLDSEIIAQLKSNVPTTFTIKTNYTGLALLRFEPNDVYPLYFHGRDFKVDLNDRSEKPVFSNNVENDFLYEWINSYQQLKESTASDKECTAKSELMSHPSILIENERLLKIDALNSAPSISINILLQARLLNESTLKIKTKEELRIKKVEFQNFVQKNISHLYHSDMLQEMCRRDLMMNEYVLVTKDEVYDQTNEDVKRWGNMVSSHIEAKETVKFMMEIFYRRSMVSLAGNILQNNREVLNRKVFRNSSNVDPLYTIGDQIPNITIRNINNSIERKVSDFNTNKKIISFVESEDIISKVATISLARDLHRAQRSVPIIILPSDRLSEGHFEMEKMLANSLHYTAKNETELEAEKCYFQFYLLDENNIITMASNNKNELIQEILYP